MGQGHRAIPRIGVAAIFAAVVGILPLLPAAAQQPEPAPPTATQPAVSTAPVVIDGHELFRVRGVTAFPAEKRAALIVGRIRGVAKSVALDAIEVTEAADVSTIMAGQQPLMGVFDADAELEGVARPVLARVYQARIKDAVATFREERTPRALLFSGLYALGATLIAVVAWWLVIRTARRLPQYLDRRYRARFEHVEFEGFPIVTAEQVWTATHGIIRLARAIALIAVTVVYLGFALGLFPWTRGFSYRLSALVLDPLATIGSTIVAEVPNFIFLAILFFLVRYLLKLGRLFFDALAHERVHLASFDPEWAWPTYRIIRLVVVVFSLVVAYPYIPGSETAAFKGISIFLGVIFSLGSSTVIANLIAGYTMTYRRAFRIGDRIKVQDTVGDVLEMRLMVTHLRSLKNEEIVIPNSVILNSEVVNYTTMARQEGLILHTTVGIGYEVPWRQVEAMLCVAARRTHGLLADPPPFVLQRELGDFAVTYELNVYCGNAHDMMALYSALHRNILDVFNEYGIQIMTPAYERDTPEPKIVPKDRWFEPPASPDKP